MKRAAVLILATGLILGLTGCYSQTEYLRDKAEQIKICTEAGGEWYTNDPAWNPERCHFDTRKDSK
ncbi:hypothetical protein ACIPY0_20300 [Paenarthrobacter nicotinovorans]|uniref:hypothetical protein n=1 Tax=Paenarthrobacter nicotinovorans TaxID=29320 RepID=UPI0037F908ED